MSKHNFTLLVPEGTLGDRFRMFREKIGKSREEMAREMNRSVDLVKKIEIGKSMPPILCLYDLLQTYKLDINWLLNGTSETEKEEIPIAGLPPRLIKKYCKKRGIPVKEKYDELIELLQVPEVNKYVFSKLTECKHIFKNEIEDHIKSGKLKNINS